jgi:hypothetical protein
MSLLRVNGLKGLTCNRDSSHKVVDKGQAASGSSIMGRYFPLPTRSSTSNIPCSLGYLIIMACITDSIDMVAGVGICKAMVANLFKNAALLSIDN